MYQINLGRACGELLAALTVPRREKDRLRVLELHEIQQQADFPKV